MKYFLIFFVFIVFSCSKDHDPAVQQLLVNSNMETGGHSLAIGAMVEPPLAVLLVLRGLPINHFRQPNLCAYLEQPSIRPIFGIGIRLTMALCPLEKI